MAKCSQLLNPSRGLVGLFFQLFKKIIYSFICLFMAALGLCCFCSGFL